MVESVGHRRLLPKSLSRPRRASPSSASSTCRASRSVSRPNTCCWPCSADYWSGRCEPLPSAALVDLLAEFDVNQSGARAALSRLSIRGLLVGTKDGRNTFYRVADGFRHMLPYGPIHTRAFAKPKPDWDGMWTMVAFTVPEDQRRLRPMLRGRLQSLGFAPLYDGLWVSPHAADHELDIALEIAPPQSCTVIRATELPAAAAWRWRRRGTSTSSATSYDEFIRTFRPVLRTPRQRSNRPDRGPGHPHPGNVPVVRVRGHRPGSSRGAAAAPLAEGRCARSVRRPGRRVGVAGDRAGAGDRLASTTLSWANSSRCALLRRWLTRIS